MADEAAGLLPEEVVMGDSIFSDLTSRYLESVLRQQRDWFNSPQMVELRARHRAQWLARPWYERAFIRSKVRIRHWRIRLGEIIAGQEFDD